VAANTVLHCVVPVLIVLLMGMIWFFVNPPQQPSSPAEPVNKQTACDIQAGFYMEASCLGGRRPTEEIKNLLRKDGYSEQQIKNSLGE